VPTAAPLHSFPAAAFVIHATPETVLSAPTPVALSRGYLDHTPISIRRLDSMLCLPTPGKSARKPKDGGPTPAACRPSLHD
jgi:hypothetical protein